MGGIEGRERGRRGAGFTGEGEFCLQGWALPYRQFLLGAVLSWGFSMEVKKNYFILTLLFTSQEFKNLRIFFNLRRWCLSAGRARAGDSQLGHWFWSH